MLLCAALVSSVLALGTGVSEPASATEAPVDSEAAANADGAAGSEGAASGAEAGTAEDSAAGDAGADEPSDGPGAETPGADAGTDAEEAPGDLGVVEDHTGYDPDAWDRAPEAVARSSEAVSDAASPAFAFDLPYKLGDSWGANGPHSDDGGAGTRNAIDFAGGDGKVRAPADGTVRFAPCSGVVIIEHADGWRTSYYHMEGVRVSAGQKVARGDWIGNIGNDASCGGYSTGAHVHLAVWKYSGSNWSARKPVSLEGMGFGGWKVRERATAYFGTWTRNSDNWVYTTNGYASCGCITNYGGEKPFTTTAAPKIDGTAMVGSKLTAVTAGWKPVPTTFTYQWKRGGKSIPGATKSTYTLTADDAGAKITLTVKASRIGYQAASKTSAATVPVVLLDSDGDSVPDAQSLMPWNSDVNGDGLADVVAFSASGVTVALMKSDGSTGAASIWSTAFKTGSTWNPATTLRTMVDVNGDGKADAVGFGPKGIYVALSTGKGFASATLWLADFGANQGWNSTEYPRGLADMNGDGRPDAVGFSDTGVTVALNTGSAFAAAKMWSGAFSSSSWRVDTNPRFLVDVDGDGKTDVLGFGNKGVYVALSTGAKLGGSKIWTSEFAANTPWQVTKHPRVLADVDGDGRPDIVGFGSKAVRVSFNTGSAFGTSKAKIVDFGYGTATAGAGEVWQVDRHPRVLADVNGDGRADIVGFGESATRVALSTGSGFADAKQWAARFGFNDGQWRVDSDPRMVTDVNGDGKADVVAFGSTGAVAALSTGSAFAAGTKLATGFRSRSDGWQVYSDPRSASVQSFQRSPAPAVGGSAVQGQTLTAKPGAWQPVPTRYSYQWLRDGAKISGATKSTYRVAAADAGAKLSVRVTATRSGVATTTRTSARVSAKGVLTPVKPTVSGTRTVGKTLTAKPGTWKPGTVKLKYQWLRNGKAISGATARTYKLTGKDAGARISVVVTGSRSGYVTSASTSGRTGAIAKGTLSPVVPKISGTAKSGKTLRAKAGKWKPGTVALSYQWKRNGKAISGATKAKYKLSAKDRGKKITVTVRGAKTGYATRSKTSQSVSVK